MPVTSRCQRAAVNSVQLIGVGSLVGIGCLVGFGRAISPERVGRGAEALTGDHLGVRTYRQSDKAVRAGEQTVGQRRDIAQQYTEMPERTGTLACPSVKSAVPPTAVS